MFASNSIRYLGKSSTEFYLRGIFSYYRIRIFLLLVHAFTCLYFYISTKIAYGSSLTSAEVGDYDEALDREHLHTHEYVPRQERALHRILAFHRELA